MILLNIEFVTDRNNQEAQTEQNAVWDQQGSTQDLASGFGCAFSASDYMRSPSEVPD